MFLRLTLLLALTAFSTADHSDEEKRIREGYNATTRKYKLIWPLSGAPGGPYAAYAALFILIDYVNHNRSDILSDYYIIPDLQYGILQNQVARYYSELQLENGTYIAPMFTGPDGGCEEGAPTFRGMKMIQISQSCSGAYISTNRRTMYNGLYSTLAAMDTYKYAVLEAIRSVGHWDWVGIFYSWNIRDNSIMAINTFKTLTRNGVVVKEFIGCNYVGGLKADLSVMRANTRIVVLMPSGSNECRAMLCDAFHQGLRPPFYAFIVTIPACLTTSLDRTYWLHEGCTYEIIETQISASLFVGVPTIPFDLPQNSSLGLSPQQYNQMIDERIRTYAQPVDDYSMRYAYYDVFMTSVLVLNETEEMLKSQYNLSLRDYRSVCPWKPENPESPTKQSLVFSVVNKTAATMVLKGFRNKYITRDPNMDVTQEISIMQPYQGQARLVGHLTYTGQIFSGGFSFTADDEPIWATKTGKAPKDLSVVEHRVALCGNRAISTVASVAAVLSFSEILLFVASLTIKAELFYENWKKYIACISCLCLNASAVFLVLGADYAPAIECKYRQALTAAGVSLLSSLIFAQLVGYAKMVKYRRPRIVKKEAPRYANGFANLKYICIGRSRHSRVRDILPRSRRAVAKESQGEIDKTTTGTPTRIRTLLASNKYNNALKINQTFGAVSACSFLILLVWLVTGSMRIQAENTPISYDKETGDVFDVILLKCVYSSEVGFRFLLTMLVFNGVVCLVANFLLITLRKRNMPDEFAFSSRLIRVAAINALTMLSAAVLILIIVYQTTTRPCDFNVALATCEIVFSAAMAAILLLPISVQR